jgi:uncharacterized protein (DUF4415 family)
MAAIAKNDDGIGCSSMAKRQKSFKPGRGYTKEDWDAVCDSPELTAEDFANAKPFQEAFPELAASIRRARGANKPPTKKLVSLRLSGQVIEAYKAKGPDWQSRIDADLRRINKIK